MTKTVSAILRSKGHDIFSVSPDSTVFDALKIMAEGGVGALLVIETGKLVGILSERDYARKVILLGKSSREAKVKEIMSDKVFYVQPYRTAEECMALMINKRIRHLPVLDNENLVGVISIGDVVKAVIDEKEFVIEQLEEYISGRKINSIV
ncbi:MAG TPA: CBS domain-containing protein [Ignavibacteriaceae bacterium]|nr:CBS domain-containing protein [Ignavibacteriaceae bacterium]